MNDDMFDELVASVREGAEILRGGRKPSSETRFDAIDVRRVRERLEVTRAVFAAMLGISERTLEGWEQGRRRPTGPAQTLLLVAEHHPEAIIDTFGLTRPEDAATGKGRARQRKAS